jgi:DNA repair exonuclease SbcCD ATPase subunit
MLKRAFQKIDALLDGRPDVSRAAQREAAPEERALLDRIDRLASHLAEVRTALLALAGGELDLMRFSRDNTLAHPVKELQSRLRHLTWQTHQIAGGDYGQRIDYMGGLAEAFNRMAEALDRKDRELTQKIEALERALAKVNRLERLLPLCMYCKKIRTAGTGGEQWEDLDRYVRQKTDTEFSHSICPACLRRQFPDIDPEA